MPLLYMVIHYIMQVSCNPCCKRMRGGINNRELPYDYEVSPKSAELSFEEQKFS